MPMKAEREYRRIDVRNLETREEENGKMIVEGYATTFNQEYCLFEEGDFRFMESVDAAAFDGCDMSDVIMQYDHAGRVFARTGNGTLVVKPDEHGLHIAADLGGTDLGRQLYQEIKGGYTNRMSFGFTVARDEETEKEDAGGTTHHRKIMQFKKLYDVSAVSIPANDYTEISARGLNDGAIRKALEDYQERRRKLKIIKILTEV